MKLKGLLWISIYVILAIIPLGIILFGAHPPGRAFLHELAVAFGFIGLAVMGLQFALTGRFKRLKAPFGSDVVYSFHRHISIVAFALILAHPLLLAFFVPEKVWIRLDFVHHPLYPRWGLYAFLCLLALIVTSVYRERLKLSYERWRRLHGLFAVGAVGFGVAHAFEISHYLNQPEKKAVWTVYTLACVAILAFVRAIKPWQERRTPYIVDRVIPGRGDTTTLVLKPRGHCGFRFHPGQFAWISLRQSAFSDREHPFSFSGSAERAPVLEFAIKSLGDFTSTVSSIRPGEIAYVDGPFGALTTDRHPHHPGYVFIAGGIGITPMMSHLRTFADRDETRPAYLFYANRTLEQTPYYEEIEALRSKLPLFVVHVLAQAPADWRGERGFVTEEILRRHLPARYRDFFYLLCGPDPMMNAVESALLALGVPLEHIDSERFKLV